MMTAEERARMNELCKCIQEEQDPQKLPHLLEQFNALIESKEERLASRTEEQRGASR